MVEMNDSVLGIEWENLGKINSPAAAIAPEPKDQIISIMTREVIYNQKGIKYDPIEVFQNIECTGEFSFETISNAVWNHYGPAKGYTQQTHQLSLIIGNHGPIATKPYQLRKHLQDLRVFFEKKSILVDNNRFPSTVQKSGGENTEELRSSGSSDVSIQSLPEVVPIRRVENENKRFKFDQEKTIKKSVWQKIDVPKAYPDFMKLGRTIPFTSTWESGTVKSLTNYHDRFVWSEKSELLLLRGDFIDAGGFRLAYRCSVKNSSALEDGEYVFKIFTAETVQNRTKNWQKLLAHVADGNCPVDSDSIKDGIIHEKWIKKELNEKAVQAQAVAQLIAGKLSEELGTRAIRMPTYIPSWFVELSDGSLGTLEPYLEGSFVKYTNNSMTLDGSGDSDMTLKAIALSHYSYAKSYGKILLTDAQGVGSKFTDPEIATGKPFIVENGEIDMYFGPGNMDTAIPNFLSGHTCNKYCKMAKLDPMTA